MKNCYLLILLLIIKPHVAVSLLIMILWFYSLVNSKERAKKSNSPCILVCY